MKIDDAGIENSTFARQNQKENRLKKRDFFRKNSANILFRICAWGIDVAITGVLATIASKSLGNNFQDPFFGPLFLYMVCGFFYASFMESSPWQGTAGKHLLRMKVVRTDGMPLSSWQAAWRNFLRATVFLSVGLSYLMGIVHPQKATAHDILSFTRVVRTTAPSLDGATWRPSKLWQWIPTVAFTGLNVVVVLILGVVTWAIVHMRGQVHDGYKQLAPYMAVVEKASPQGKNFPSSVTEATRGVRDENLLPGSGYKARYLPGLGQFVLEVPNLEGNLILGFLPVGNPYNETDKAAWVCLGAAPTTETQHLYSLLTPATCSTKPFHEKIRDSRRPAKP